MDSHTTLDLWNCNSVLYGWLCYVSTYP